MLFLSDDEDEEKRVVRSQKDKRFDCGLSVEAHKFKSPFTDLTNSKT